MRTHDSRNTQSLELRFRALLTQGGTPVPFYREDSNPDSSHPVGRRCDSHLTSRSVAAGPKATAGPVGPTAVPPQGVRRSGSGDPSRREVRSAGPGKLGRRTGFPLEFAPVPLPRASREPGRSASEWPEISGCWARAAVRVAGGEPAGSRQPFDALEPRVAWRHRAWWRCRRSAGPRPGSKVGLSYPKLPLRQRFVQGTLSTPSRRGSYPHPAPRS
jgi:hypothetical protein